MKILDSSFAGTWGRKGVHCKQLAAGTGAEQVFQVHLFGGFFGAYDQGVHDRYTSAVKCNHEQVDVDLTNGAMKVEHKASRRDDQD